jgi:WD40 repeat protein
MRRWTANGDIIDTVSSRHARSVKCVATSFDGRYTASGSYGGTVDIFDHVEGEWIGRLRRPTASGISSLTWCGEREKFLAASYDGSVYQVPVHED